MKKIIPIVLICTSFLVTVPSRANAFDPQQVSRSSPRATNLLIAQFRRHNRQYHVYYRSSRDSRWTWNWTFGGIYANHQDAERAARRWENRGYKTSIRVRGGETNRRGDWNRGDWNRGGWGRGR
ncbi:hypothetical protein [Chamaesiphon minutus]|uniref:Sporulation related protein n=1 Tax=Chamaesiphon minutus (strain ATCC 27169 / PCC 6605) TaxID=1173020 RepID=K9UCQ9_CHAP6|nr:hypothetical protein [Chamaesiphon minutus]AFY92221.1 hypothetical protein Cha6605_0970 [Chamaesiphon minutus PCC 6605]